MANIPDNAGAITIMKESNDTLHDQLLLAFSCVVADRSALYVSGPITTGRRFVRWYQSSGHLLDDHSAQYREAFRRHVLVPNESDVRRATAKIRESHTQVAIEPTRLEIANWTQGDFHGFWSTVIEKFCNRMIAIDGWQYSVGCAVEFRCAVQIGILVESGAGHQITPSEGRALILDAADEIAASNAAAQYERLELLSKRLRNSAHF